MKPVTMASSAFGQSYCRASEWLCIGGVLVRARNEAFVVDWVRDIRAAVNWREGPVLDFRNLTPAKKQAACQRLVERDVICFAICSNKKNMRGYANSGPQ